MNPTTIAPGRWLDAPAARSYARMRAAGMPAGGITDAGRTRAEQEHMWREYLAGRLVATAARPGTSKHERGNALDMATASAAHAWMLAHAARHGWSRPLLHAAKPEPWHWEYAAAWDRHLTDDTTPPAPPTPAEPDTPEDDEMRPHLIYHPHGSVAVLRPALGEMQILRTADEPDALIAAGLVDPTATVDLRPTGSSLIWDLARGVAQRADKYIP